MILFDAMTNAQDIKFRTSRNVFDPQKVRMRKMVLADVERVAEMEKNIFSLPWSKESIDNFLIHDKHGEALVVEYERSVIGYAFYWIVADKFHIANFAVDEVYRRNKIGEQLMHYMLRRAKDAGALYAYLEVRKSNRSAIQLYNKFNFFQSGMREQYYTDTKEDALIMMKIL